MKVNAHFRQKHFNRFGSDEAGAYEGFIEGIKYVTRAYYDPYNLFMAQSQSFLKFKLPPRSDAHG